MVLSALKPAENGEGLVLRVLNPSGEPLEAEVRLGFDFTAAEPVRLDEAPADQPLRRDGERLRFPVPPHALRSLRVNPLQRRSGSMGRLPRSSLLGRY